MVIDSTGLQSGSSTHSERGGVTAGSPGRIDLPVIGRGVVRERADAARNRLRVLAAAERLFAAGVNRVTMDDIAAEAGVGKGTLYRRFGDKGGLAVALLDERERELQQRILSGPPPLGPGAAPAARLAAFIAAYLDLASTHIDLVQLSETSAPGARLRTGAYAFWRQHVRYLLDDTGAADSTLRADLLLAGLAAEQVRHWLHDEGRDLADLADGMSAASHALAQPPP